MSDPTKEPSVSGCGLSRRRNRRISQEQRDTIRRNSVFPAAQNGMQDGDTGFDNTPANRLKNESIRQLPPPPPGFERAGSMADAEAIKPVEAPAPVPSAPVPPPPAEPKPMYPWTFENLDKIDAIVAEGESDVTQEHTEN